MDFFSSNKKDEKPKDIVQIIKTGKFVDGTTFSNHIMKREKKRKKKKKWRKSWSCRDQEMFIWTWIWSWTQIDIAVRRNGFLRVLQELEFLFFFSLFFSSFFFSHTAVRWWSNWLFHLGFSCSIGVFFFLLLLWKPWSLFWSSFGLLHLGARVFKGVRMVGFLTWNLFSNSS